MTRSIEPPDREDGDIRLSRLIKTGLAVLGVTVLAAIVCAWLIAHFEARHADEERAEGRPAFSAPRGPYPEPTLELTSGQQRQDVRDGEARILTTTEWEDREAGVIRIPVERAIALMATEPDPMRPVRSREGAP